QVTGLNFAGDDLIVSGVLHVGATQLHLTSGADTITVPLQAAGDPVPAQAERAPQVPGSGGFTATVSLRELLATAEGDGIDDTLRWDVSVTDPGTGEVCALVPAEDVADVRRLIGPIEAAAERGPGGYLRLS